VEDEVVFLGGMMGLLGRMRSLKTLNVLQHFQSAL
jgi:hypothetical protein